MYIKFKMKDYSKSCIYTVRCLIDNDLIYVGSTTKPLSQRYTAHKYGKKCSLYKYINNNFNGDWNDWYIELYEEYPCDNVEQLNKREGEIIRLIGTINSSIAGRTSREYYLDNIDKILEQKKQYYLNHRDKRLEQMKQYSKEYYILKKSIVPEIKNDINIL